MFNVITTIRTMPEINPSNSRLVDIDSIKPIKPATIKKNKVVSILVFIVISIKIKYFQRHQQKPGRKD